MRRLLACVAVLLALSGVASASAPRNPVLIATTGDTLSYRLVLADPVSLRPLPGRSRPLRAVWGPGMRSPDGSLVTLGRNDAAQLRFVRLPSLRDAATMTLASGGHVWPVAWPSRRLLIAELDLQTPLLVGIDPVRRKILWRRWIAGGLLDLERSRGGIVMLLAGSYSIGPPLLLSVGADGSVRTVILEGIRAGSEHDDSGIQPVGHIRTPGLAVDRVGNRAFVVSAGDPTAEVDLSTMRVTYHGERTFSKAFSGPQRRAAWVGNGLLAVAGTDSTVSTDAQGRLRWTTAPSGLVLVDTRTWQERPVQPDASDVAVAGGAFVAFGSRLESGSTEPVGAGVTIYGSDGTARVHLLEQTPVWQVLVQDGLAYAFATRRRIFVIDVAAGRVLTTADSSTVNALVTR